MLGSVGGPCPLLQDSMIRVSTCVLSSAFLYNHEVPGTPLAVLPLYSAQSEHLDRTDVQNRLTQFFQMCDPSFTQKLR